MGWSTGVQSPEEAMMGFLHFVIASRPGFGTHPTSYPMATGGSYSEVKRPGCEADRSPPSSTKVKTARSYISAPQYVFVVWCLIKQWIHFHGNSRDSSVGIAPGYGLYDRGSRRGLGIILFTTASRTALEHTKTPIQWVPGTLSMGVKRPGREDDHSPPSSGQVKEWVELYFHSLSMSSWRDT
jgi:hypothetical protein